MPRLGGMQGAFAAVPRKQWRDHQIAILKNLAGAGWTRADYRRLHYLSGDFQTAGWLLKAGPIRPALVRSLWQTPDWMWTRKLLRCLSAPGVARVFAAPANRELLFGLAAEARPGAIRALRTARPATLRACLAELRGADMPVRSFPRSPIAATDALRPLDSFTALRREGLITGVAFETFYDAIFDRACYFFAWLGHPRATVLVVFDESIKHIECRKSGDIELTAEESAPLVVHVMDCFERTGFVMNRARLSH